MWLYLLTMNILYGNVWLIMLFYVVITLYVDWEITVWSGFFSSLMTFKVFNSIVLLGKAYTLIEEKEKMEAEEQQNKKFDKQEYAIDPNSLEKFNQVYQKSTGKARFPQCAETNLSQSIPNIHEKCKETELRKFESVMELPVIRHEKVDLHTQILEEKPESTVVNEQDLNNSSKVEELQHSLGADNGVLFEHSGERNVRRRTGARLSSHGEERDSSPASPTRQRLISTESTVWPPCS